MTIGDRIKQSREISGLQQAELAKMINISKQTMYKYENNIVTNIPSDKIEQLSKILNVTPCYLMGWEEPRRERDTDLQISPLERKIIESYRSMEKVQESVCILLGLEEDYKLDKLYRGDAAM